MLQHQNAKAQASKTVQQQQHACLGYTFAATPAQLWPQAHLCSGACEVSLAVNNIVINTEWMQAMTVLCVRGLAILTLGTSGVWSENREQKQQLLFPVVACCLFGLLLNVNISQKHLLIYALQYCNATDSCCVNAAYYVARSRTL